MTLHKYTIFIIIGCIILVFLFLYYLYTRKKYDYIGFSLKDLEELTDTNENIMVKFWKYFNKNKKQESHPRINKTENKCRKILERIYGLPFETIRPDWLKSPKTGKNLELDCYNQQLNIALEFNGKQHYSYVPYFHKSKKEFFSQVHRDDWKRKKCIEKGITLIEIPYWVIDTELEKYIREQLITKQKL